MTNTNTKKQQILLKLKSIEEDMERMKDQRDCEGFVEAYYRQGKLLEELSRA